MNYIDSLYLPSDHQETGFLMSQRRTCYNGCYPYKIFPQKGLSEINFAPITIFYGGNGSGKTTLLYCLAAIFGIIERSLFMSGTSTVAGFRNQLAKNNNRCIFCDEIEQNLFDKFVDLGKDSFSGTPRKKSSSDGSEVVTEINTSFCATTNHFFQNFSFAGVSRTIIVNMH